MIKILVAGSHSKVGKTKFIERLIKELKLLYKIGVIKLQYGIAYKQAKLINDITVINQKGKDTKRFIDAGAFKVILIKHNRSNIKLNILKSIKTFFKNVKLLIIEGNSGFLKDYYSLIIFVKSFDKLAKPGVKRIEKSADFIIDKNFSNYNNIVLKIKELFDGEK